MGDKAALKKLREKLQNLTALREEEAQMKAHKKAEKAKIKAEKEKENILQEKARAERVEALEKLVLRASSGKGTSIMSLHHNLVARLSQKSS